MHNMKRNSTYSLALLILALLTSCEKVIDINVENDIGKLVIEGLISNASSEQEIKLTRNIAFSDVNSYPAVSGASVIVSDDAQNDYLFRETAAGVYTATGFTGKPGSTYRMEVEVKGDTYVAQSEMPHSVTLDSLAVETPTIGDKDTRNIKVFYSDSKNQPNQYRFVLFINGKQVKDIYAVNDDFNDGQQVSLTLRPKDVTIAAGDQIRVDMLGIDQAVYRYWFTHMQQSTGAGITPNNPPTNISPTTLGYFSAQTYSSRTVTAN